MKDPRRALFVVLLLASASDLVFAEVRTWTDVSGKFEIEAEFVQLNGENVVLEQEDGKKLTIPLDRLSEKDREHVRSLMKDAAENPFKPVEKAGIAGKIDVSWDDVPEVPTAAGDRWEVAIGEVDELGFNPKIVGLPKRTDFFEKANGLAISGPGKRAVISYVLGRPGRTPDGVTSRIVVIDLESGRQLANASTKGNFTVLAVHDDGKRIVAERATSSGRSPRDTEHSLVTLTAEGSDVVLVDEWTPYKKEQGSSHVRFAAFAGENRFVTCNEPGVVAVWDFEKRTPEFFFQIPRTSIPSLSPDRRYVGFCGGNKVGFVNLETRQPVAMKPAEAMTFWVKGRFSPSGRRFAASSQQKLMVWDTTTGEVLFEGEVPGVSLAFGLEFPAEDFVLLSNEYLVEWTSGIKVWQYTGGGPRVGIGSTLFVAGDALVPVDMPHPAAVSMLAEAKKQSDLFIVKKGTAVRVDVSAIPKEYRDEVQASLVKRIEESGQAVDDDANVTVRATVTGPKKDSVSYFRAGSFEIDKYSSTIAYVYAGQTVWSSTRNNVPGVLYTPRDKSYQQQIDEAGAKPNLKFFGTANLPEYLQKPTAKEKAAPAGRGQQTLGVSAISATGTD